ncbi:MAG: formate dehydrogenase accessory sulfurtransferase FdhD [Peptococcaceae bacterium]|jgi:FdhD protein|nr:formate dehydrogenase accessory sulfurtransferase FdhD [Peptococcaceae bacterium]
MQESAGVADAGGVTAEVGCARFSGGRWVRSPVQVPSEAELTIYVNQRELVTVLCTPTRLNYLVLGFLYAEGIIAGLDDVVTMRVCGDEAVADVRLANPAYEPPVLRTLTSGCGGGAVFQTTGEMVESDFVTTPGETLLLMKRLQAEMDLYRTCGGVHTSALAGAGHLLVVAEDIGRHNTLDKIQGECLAGELPTRDRLLLTTGRVSKEMLLKAARMRVPVVVSRHSPTGTAVELARDLGIALVGHAAGDRLTVYSHPERLGCPADRVL